MSISEKFGFLKSKKNLIKIIVSVILISVVVVDVGYHISRSFSGTVDSVPAKTSSVDAGFNAKCYIVRSEEEVYSQMTGNVEYLLTDGEKVAANGNIANVYYKSGGSLSMIDTLDILNSTRNALVSASRRWNEATTSDIDSSISGISEKIFRLMEDGNIGNANSLVNEYHSLICAKDEASGITDTKKALSSCDDSILIIRNKIGEAKETVVSKVPGWFYRNCDGYEKRVTPETVFSLSIESAKNLFDPSYEYVKSETSSKDITTVNQSDPDALGEYSERSLIGKIVDSEKWYAVILLDKEKAPYFSTGKTYKCSFGIFDFQMKLEKAITETGNPERLLIFSCDTMAPGFEFDRISDVFLSYKTFSGYKIPLSALRYTDGICGVYIRRGFLVQYREVVPLYVNDGYAIVNSDPDSISGISKTISENDNVIVRGTDIYAGKIIK